MLIEFIHTHRENLIARTRGKVAQRRAPLPTTQALKSGVPLFLDHLARKLRDSLATSNGDHDQSAAMHGADLLNRGYTIAQVVHDYGDICQAITELATEVGAPITIDEFHILNLCLDNAIAGAVSEFIRLRDQSLATGETERSGAFAHELRNKLAVVQMGFQLITNGRAPIGGSVASVVERSLRGMNGLIDRALVNVRVDSGNIQLQRLHLHQVIEEAELDGALEANARSISLSVVRTDQDIDVEGDPQVLAGAIGNLLQNAFKFTDEGGRVALRTAVVGERVEIEIEDECGGLPPGKAEELFDAFKQRGKNRTGLGLGLFVSRKGIEASGGSIRVRNLPGSGCVFTIDLRRLPHA